MGPALLSKIHQFRRLPHGAYGSFDDSSRRAGYCHNRTVMVSVKGVIEKVDAIDLHGANDRNNLADILSLGKVRNTLDNGFLSHEAYPSVIRS